MLQHLAAAGGLACQPEKASPFFDTLQLAPMETAAYAHSSVCNYYLRVLAWSHFLGYSAYHLEVRILLLYNMKFKAFPEKYKDSLK